MCPWDGGGDGVGEKMLPREKVGLGRRWGWGKDVP
jgi:hypothetical protein